MNETTTKTINLIGEAFADVRLGEGRSLHQARQTDESWTADCDKVRSARRDDAGRSWSEVPPATLNQYGSTMGFLDDAGFRFYLPALMTQSLLEPEGHVAEMVLSHLKVTGLSGLKARKGLSRAQAVAIAEFLSHMQRLAPDRFASSPAFDRTVDQICTWASTGKQH